MSPFLLQIVSRVWLIVSFPSFLVSILRKCSELAQTLATLRQSLPSPPSISMEVDAAPAIPVPPPTTSNVSLLRFLFPSSLPASPWFDSRAPKADPPSFSLSNFISDSSLRANLRPRRRAERGSNVNRDFGLRWTRSDVRSDRKPLLYCKKAS